jgi:hypothetical protein
MDDSISLKHLIIYLCTIFMYVPVGNCALIVEECCYVTHVRIVLYLCYSMYLCFFRADCTMYKYKCMLLRCGKYKYCIVLT